MNKKQYISVPFRSGCNREGAQFAPSRLCELLGLDDTHTQQLRLSSENQPLSDNQCQGVKNYETVLVMANRLRDMVANSMSENHQVVTLGGDHSLALGSIAGVLTHEPNVGIIWFDAHTDINTEASSPSGNAHGMPVAALMGLCQFGLNEVAPVRLKPQNIFWVGARDIDPGEEQILRQLGIYDHVYSTNDVHRLGMKAVMDDIRQRMAAQEIPALHLSFDIDGMDSSIVAATGTKVPNGLTQDDLDTFIQSLSSLPPMHSMDFVEYNPLMDDEQQTTGKWCKETLEKLCSVLKCFIKK